MEAANRGAHEAGGKTIGLNIRLPFEQAPNRYITDELHFEFHYFFMRKFWFAYLAKALVIFPGGFGTLDEMFEILTLAQTRKLSKKLLVILYGSEYWNEVLRRCEPLAEWGAIDENDLDLLCRVDSPDEAFEELQEVPRRPITWCRRRAQETKRARHREDARLTDGAIDRWTRAERDEADRAVPRRLPRRRRGAAQDHARRSSTRGRAKAGGRRARSSITSPTAR